MPQWLAVSIGLAVGLLIIAAAVYFAVRPSVVARPRGPLFPASPDARDTESGWAGSDNWSGDGSHSSGSDGQVH
jgi:hypothetical protein